MKQPKKIILRLENYKTRTVRGKPLSISVLPESSGDTAEYNDPCFHKMLSHRKHLSEATKIKHVFAN